MNKGIYRLVFSKWLGILVPCAEIANAHGKVASGESNFSPCMQGGEGAREKEARSVFNIKALVLFLATAICSPFALANPTNPTVVSGAASFSQSGSSLTVASTPNAIINWGSFSIGQNELTKFVQQSSSSAVLNRVIGQDPSQILGQLQSNGRVFLINPNGVLFGQGARIDVAGLIASSLDISNADFLAGKLKFAGLIAESSVKNAGNITTPSGGQIILIAPNVENSGVITSPNGEIILAAGHTVELTDTLNPALRVEIAAPEGQALNLGSLIAESGQVGMYAGLTTQSGTISATSAVAEGGRIYLKGTKAAILTAGSVTEANGTKGGEITVTSAETTTVEQGAMIQANAGQNGDGGKVLVWSDGTTVFDGSIEAKGGAQRGNGGFAEVSGLQGLGVTGHADLSASNGKAGEMLLDPGSITISTAASNAATGTLNDVWVNTQLGNSSLTLATTNSSLTTNNATQDITVDAALNWATANTLTLNAGRNIAINQNITASGGGGLILNSGQNGTGTSILVSTIGLAGGTLSTSANTVVTGEASLGRDSVWNNTGILNVSGYFYLDSNSQLNNLSGGNVTLKGSIGHLGLSDGSQFNNQAGGVVSLTGTYGLPVLGKGSFNNAGTLTKTSTTKQTISSFFNNTGRVNVNASNLTLSGIDKQEGMLSVASGATLTLAGMQELNSGVAFTGVGTVNFGGIINLNTSVAFDSISPALTLLSGSINGSATNVFTTTATTVVTGGVTLGANSVWNNTATLDISGANGYLNLDSGSQLNNQAGGVVTLSGANGIPVMGSGRMNNSGTLNKTSVSSQTLSSVFNNTGIVAVTSGTLNLSNNGTDTGVYDIASGATLAFTGGARSITANGVSTFTGTDAIQGAGQVSFLGGSLAFAGAGSTNDTTAINLAVAKGPLVTGNISQPANGSVKVNPDGTFTYTPNGVYSGTEDFSYEVRDTAGNIRTATITINSSVTPPEATPTMVTLPEPVDQVIAVVTNSVNLGTVDVDTPMQYLSEDAPLLAALAGTGLLPTGAGGEITLDQTSSDTMTIAQVDSLITQLVYDAKTEGENSEEAIRMVCR